MQKRSFVHIVIFCLLAFFITFGGVIVHNIFCKRIMLRASGKIHTWRSVPVFLWCRGYLPLWSPG